MKKFFAVLLASMAVVCLSHVVKAADTPLAPIPHEQYQQHQQQQQQQLQQPQTQDVEMRRIQIVQDIKAYIKQHPHLQLLRLNKKTPVSRSQSVKYSLGNRVTGDRLVAQFADTVYYPAKKDVSMQVTYPESGNGKLVTSVDINCLQDTHDGNAYVVAGGIGQRFISIVMEAPQTERFTYNIHIYGSD